MWGVQVGYVGRTHEVFFWVLVLLEFGPWVIAILYEKGKMVFNLAEVLNMV